MIKTWTKKVEKEIEGDVLVKQFRLNTHVESVSKMTLEMAERTLYAYDGIKWFDEPLKGKAYLTYPLSVIAEVDIDAKSIGQLLWQLAQAYKEIYSDEDKSIKNFKVTQKDQRTGLINRNKTDGYYGIWAHDISDLYFEGLAIYKNGVIDVGIGS